MIVSPKTRQNSTCYPGLRCYQLPQIGATTAFADFLVHRLHSGHAHDCYEPFLSPSLVTL